MSLRERIAAGDRQALGEAFISYRGLALKMLHQRGRRGADIDDLIQDAFLELPSCARRCAPQTSLGGCVAAAVIHACHLFDGHASTKRRTHLEVTELQHQADPALNPEEAAARSERVHHLSELVERLSEHQREALIARELHGASSAEIAARFGTSTVAAQKATSNARSRLVELAASSPLAEVFAAMPSWGEGRGSSRSSRWLQRRKALTRAV